MLEKIHDSIKESCQGQSKDASDNRDGFVRSQQGCPVLGRLIVVGANFRTADLTVRSALAVTENCLEQFLRDLKEQGVEECFVLSTCHRVEVYALTPQNAIVLRALSDKSGIPAETLKHHLYVHTGTQAINHLLRVVSGLDSAVLGETEVVSQVKSAWLHAVKIGTVGPIMDEFLRKSFETSKRVRSETEISRFVTSVASLAMREASREVGGLEGKRVLVLGAGQIAERIVKYLAEHRPEMTIVLNRTESKARRLAASVNGAYGNLDGFARLLGKTDVVVTALSAETPILNKAMFEENGGKECIVVDLGVPSNVQSDIDELPGIRLLNLDYLNETCRANSERRQDAVPLANEIVAEETERTAWTMHERAVAGTIRSLMEHGERVKQTTLEKMGSKLKGLTDHELQIVEEVARRVVNGMLKCPIKELKRPSDPVTESAVIRIYGLEECS